MQLVTFLPRTGTPRSGALIEGDRRIVDLEAAHAARWGAPSDALASVLGIVADGQNALDRARDGQGRNRRRVCVPKTPSVLIS